MCLSRCLEFSSNQGLFIKVGTWQSSKIWPFIDIYFVFPTLSFDYVLVTDIITIKIFLFKLEKDIFSFLLHIFRPFAQP